MCKKILYVEDEDLIRNPFSKFFRKFFEIECASNGKLGLEKFLAIDDIDLIITDIQMPVMNGLDMIENIRKINKEVLIYVTSAFDDTYHMERAYSLRTNRYIEKPLKIDVIMDFINEDFKKEIFK